VWRGALSLLEPITQEEIGFGALRKYLMNQDDYGNPIYSPEDSKWEWSKKTAAFFGKTLEPGTLDSLWRIMKDDAPGAKALAEAAGVRTSKLDLPRSLYFRAAEYRKERLKSFKDLNRALNTKDRAEIDEEWAQLTEFDKGQSEYIYQLAAGLLKFGALPEVVSDSLTRAGFSKRDAQAMVDGTWEYRPPSEKEKQVEAGGFDAPASTRGGTRAYGGRRY
jgi:hypothetical protein